MRRRRRNFDDIDAIISRYEEEFPKVLRANVLNITAYVVMVPFMYFFTYDAPWWGTVGAIIVGWFCLSLVARPR